jgi:hypothetical protein
VRLINGVHNRWTKEENVSRKMDKARQYCKLWNGTGGLKKLRHSSRLEG